MLIISNSYGDNMNINTKIKEVNYEVREFEPVDLGVMGIYRRTVTPRAGVWVETIFALSINDLNSS